MRNYVTGGLIVVLVILEYLLAFTVPGVLLALNILLAGAYLFFRITRHPLTDDPMIRGGAGVIALALLLLLIYAAGFNAIPKEFKQEILNADSQQRDEMVNATAMLAKMTENEQKMIERNANNLANQPDPVMNFRIDDYDYALYQPLNEDFQQRVRVEILEEAAGPYFKVIGSLDPDNFETVEDKQNMVQMLTIGNKIVRQHVSQISGYVMFIRFMNLMFPLFIIYLIGLAVLYVRRHRHKDQGIHLARGEIMQAVAWVAILVVMLIAGGDMQDNPFMGTAILLLAIRLVIQIVFVVLAFAKRNELLGNPLIRSLAGLVAVFFLFYAIVSFVVVGPTGVNESMVDGMQRLGVFVYVFAALFALGIIIASISRKIGSAFDNPGMRRMLGFISTALKIIVGVIIIAIFSSLGMFADNPKAMVPAYFIFFLLVFAGVLVNTWMKHKKQDVGSNLTFYVRRVFGAILVIACLLIPVYSMQGLFPGFFDKVTEHPQGNVKVTNEEKKVVITWTLDDMNGVERFNIARGDGKKPDAGETPKKLNDYDIVVNNSLFKISDSNKIEFERPYYYWVEELRADDAPMFTDPYAYIPVDVNVKNLEDVFEQTDNGYIAITNDSLTTNVTYVTNDLSVTGVNIHRGDNPDALRAVRVEQEDGTWRTDVTTDKSVVQITTDPIAPTPSNTLRFIDAEGLQYGWDYYWVLEARMEDGTKQVYAPFTYSPVNSDTLSGEEIELKTQSIAFNIGKAIVLILLTAVVMALGAFGVILINRFKENNIALAIVGYIVLFLTATIPALLMMQVDSSYSSLGVAYYTAVFIALLSWWGASMLSVKAKKDAAA